MIFHNFDKLQCSFDWYLDLIFCADESGNYYDKRRPLCDYALKYGFLCDGPEKEDDHLCPTPTIWSSFEEL
jgi:hypothetical protein